MRSICIVIGFVFAAFVFGVATGTIDLAGAELWECQVVAAIVCGCLAAMITGGRFPYLACFFITLGLLLPVVGPALAMFLSLLPSQKPVSDENKREFVVGVPLRENEFTDLRKAEGTFLERLPDLSPDSVEAQLSEVIGLESVPRPSIARSFRNHAATKVNLLGQVCVAERQNYLESLCNALEHRAARSQNVDALAGICEAKTAMLDETLLSPQDSLATARQGLEVARRLGIAGNPLASNYFGAKFCLFADDIEGAEAAWWRVVESCGGDTENVSDEFHMLAAEIALYRADKTKLRDHVRAIQTDTPAKAWLQEFWMEDAKT